MIHTVFREVHSLKGFAGLLGYPQIASLSHALEDLLSRLRLGGALDGIVLDLLHGTHVLEPDGRSSGLYPGAGDDGGNTVQRHRLQLRRCGHCAAQHPCEAEQAERRPREPRRCPGDP